jgi:ribulose-5-phosphate 4-epimerase/fuculose-1-phosphate aldolase
MTSELELRVNIVETVRRMHAERLVIGTAGNVSAREPKALHFWITPSGVDNEKLRPDDLIEADLQGKARAGGLRPSSDTMNHAAIYRRRSDVGAVIHTHSTFATVFAVLHRDIPALLAEAAGFLGGAVPVMPYLSPASPELGERAAEGLGAGRAVLLPNHGVIVVGETLESAVTAALLVEQSARVAYLAGLAGKPEALPPEEVKRMHRFLHEEYGQR